MHDMLASYNKMFWLQLPDQNAVQVQQHSMMH
jgi:hypothetical protein